jgi:hypothetical protein
VERKSRRGLSLGLGDGVTNRCTGRMAVEGARRRWKLGVPACVVEMLEAAV